MYFQVIFTPFAAFYSKLYGIFKLISLQIKFTYTFIIKT